MTDVERRRSECSVCIHVDAAQIDAALLGGMAIGKVSETFGPSRSAVGRHKLRHLTSAIAEPAEVAQMEPVDVHIELTALADRLSAVIETARATRKPQIVISAGRELRATLETIARLQADPALLKAAAKRFLTEAVAQLAAQMALTPMDAAAEAAGFDIPLVNLAMAAWMRNPLDPDLTRVREVAAANRGRDEARFEAEVERRVSAEVKRLTASEVKRLEAGPAPDVVDVEVVEYPDSLPLALPSAPDVAVTPPPAAQARFVARRRW